MMTLPTAKILLFIAMNVGPHQAPLIYATSNCESYVWTDTQQGWVVEAKGFPSSDFYRDPSKVQMDAEATTKQDIPAYLQTITKYDWSRDSAIAFDNGDRVEKFGDHAFYIINAGGANEKIFTILFPQRKHTWW